MDLEIVELSEGQQEEIDDRLLELDNPKISNSLKGEVNIGITLGDGKLIAGLLSKGNDLRKLYICTLWVDEIHRGKGLGRRLLKELELRAKGLGANALETSTFWLEAADFYRNMGFTEIGSYTHPIDGYTEWFFIKFI